MRRPSRKAGGTTAAAVLAGGRNRAMLRLTDVGRALLEAHR